VAGSCADGNETSGSIKGGELIGQLSNYKLLKVSAPLSHLASYRPTRGIF
jgi:hypothetical protein